MSVLGIVSPSNLNLTALQKAATGVKFFLLNMHVVTFGKYKSKTWVPGMPESWTPGRRIQHTRVK